MKIFEREIFNALQFFLLVSPLQVRAVLSFGRFCGVFVYTAASSYEAFCLSETVNLKVLSDFIAQMRQLKFNCSAIDTIWDKLISFQPIRSETVAVLLEVKTNGNSARRFDRTWVIIKLKNTDNMFSISVGKFRDEKENNLFALIIKMQFIVARAIITSLTWAAPSSTIRIEIESE